MGQEVPFFVISLIFHHVPLLSQTRTSCAGLSLIQHFKPYFSYSSKRLFNDYRKRTCSSILD
ncbi:hypothetical protein CXP54_23640 [Escherichia albertii]|uniref:Transposase n=1 Tax=Escherichia albertii TaxID=208962 RepID=A0A2T3RMM3_ESCAL|nr:hypothetical protein CXP54_23640 [Escherichia albertii]EAB1453625.1 hypothetical protein [Escherichia albertii]EEW0114242.1 hypothetical protein [Escherichia albertii]EEW0765714.1 hypothetical protein [Escherichia albertii]EEW0790062.1 hypothetical protein [Escherichia albertii]